MAKKPPRPPIDTDTDMGLRPGSVLPKVCPFKDQVACIEEACILFAPNAGCTLKSLCPFGTLAACLL